tara:strand:- start:54 stop:296 length:243 start_codon:yes stop_codon:yes gene_type:complete
MNGKYNVLFLGTPYIDGHYDSVQDAYSAKEIHLKKFPNIEFAIVKTIHEVKLGKNIFWIPNKNNIQAFNNSNALSTSEEI